MINHILWYKVSASGRDPDYLSSTNYLAVINEKKQLKKNQLFFMIRGQNPHHVITENQNAK